MFLQWLHEESIRTSFDAAVREAALAELVAMLPSWGVNARQKSELLNHLLETQQSAVEAQGDVLICCAVRKDVAFPLASLAISRNGVTFAGTPDNHTYSCLLLAVLPETEDAASQMTHLQNDTELLFNDPFFRQRLKISESAAEAYEVLVRQSQHLEVAADTAAGDRLISVS